MELLWGIKGLLDLMVYYLKKRYCYKRQVVGFSGFLMFCDDFIGYWFVYFIKIVLIVVDIGQFFDVWVVDFQIFGYIRVCYYFVLFLLYFW